MDWFTFLAVFLFLDELYSFTNNAYHGSTQGYQFTFLAVTTTLLIYTLVN